LSKLFNVVIKKKVLILLNWTTGSDLILISFMAASFVGLNPS